LLLFPLEGTALLYVRHSQIAPKVNYVTARPWSIRKNAYRFQLEYVETFWD